MRQMTGLNELRERGRMTWIEQEHGWVAAPEEIVKALSKDGFEECKRAMTTSRRDRRPAGGVWQGVDTRTGSVASAIWINRLAWHQAIVAGGVCWCTCTGHWRIERWPCTRSRMCFFGQYSGLRRTASPGVGRSPS